MAELRRESFFEPVPPPTLAETVESFQRRTGQGIELQVEGLYTRLPAHQESEVLQILQEALHNIELHAGATRTVVRFLRSATQLELEVRDNGRGFDLRSVAIGRPGHFGLEIMRQRAERIGGRLAIESRPGVGTAIRLALPLSE